MGERKGTNHYYPPDYDPRKGGLNKFLGTHALRERARKLHMGILIIRFEMPYNIWCDGCGNHIGMGVRYNAEKSKIGMYYSTPIYQFRMKCHLCDNHFEIKTDPSNLDYVITKGARRQENRWDPKENEQVVPETKEVSRRLYDDAMFKLDHGREDTLTAKSQCSKLDNVVSRNSARWRDDYASNCALRASFRAKKKDLQSTNITPISEKEQEQDRDMARLLIQSRQKDIKTISKLPLKKLASAAVSKRKVNKLTVWAQRHKIVKHNSTITKLSAPSSDECKNSSLVNYVSTSSDSDT